MVHLMELAISDRGMGSVLDVVVIGGGVVGAAIAGALTEIGLAAALIERGSVGGQGATKYSGGIVRLYDPDPTIQALAAYSLARMADTTVGRAFSANFRRVGVYYSPVSVPSSRALSIGRTGDLKDYPIHVVSRADAANANGVFKGSSGEPVLWEPAAAIGDVRSSARISIQEVQRRGLVLENASVNTVELESDRVIVRCGRLSLQCRYVVVATGAWAAAAIPELQLFSRSVPLVRLRCGQEVSAPVIDEAAASYIVPLGQRLLQVGSRVRTEAIAPEDLRYDTQPILADAYRRLRQMAPTLDPVEALDVIRGFDSYTTDGRPLIGRAGVSPLFLATGFSGIGFKLAMGVGWLLAYEIAGCLGFHRLSKGEVDLLANFRPSQIEDRQRWQFGESNP
jgi:glycine/D-amino acid oxidase-like deaminating enzyme